MADKVDLSRVSTDDMRLELKRRGITTSEDLCTKCRKWKTRFVSYKQHQATLHCIGCMEEVEHCTCVT